MSDVRDEVERLRRDVARLRERLSQDEIEPRPGTPRRGSEGSGAPAMGDVLRARVKAARAKSGDAVAFGVARVAVYADTRGGSADSDATSIWTGPIRELPPDEKLQASATVLAHTPFQMRAMHRLLSRMYEGQPMQMTRAVLAEALGVDAAALERELAPLVKKKTLREFQTAEGEQSYELNRWDLFLLQLSLAG